MKMTISELRQKEVYKLMGQKHANDWTIDDLTEASRLMNSFYRLCGLCKKNLYLANDKRTCNRASTKRSEERENNWYNRLKKEFEAFSGLTLCYCGYMPSIGIMNENGGFTEIITRWFYQ